MEAEFPLGCRVQAHPATDIWMEGDRYGEVVGYKGKFIQVKMDRSDRILNFHLTYLLHISKEGEHDCKRTHRSTSD